MLSELLCLTGSEASERVEIEMAIAELETMELFGNESSESSSEKSGAMRSLKHSSGK